MVGNFKKQEIYQNKLKTKTLCFFGDNLTSSSLLLQDESVTSVDLLQQKHSLSLGNLTNLSYGSCRQLIEINA